MKLATFVAADGRPALGAIDTQAGTVLDLQRAATLVLAAPQASLDSMLALIEAGNPGLDVARRLVVAGCREAQRELASAALLSPLPRPPRLRDTTCFLGHVKGVWEKIYRHQGKEFSVPDIWYQRPVYYQCNTYSVVGTDADIIWPDYCTELDYELELTCVIGRPGKDLSPEQAEGHIFGYTIFNDFSARDQLREELVMQLGPSKGKDFDTGNAVGPWIVTADEVGDPHDLGMRVRLNGQPQGSAHSGAMHHRFADIVAFVSRGHSLVPGELIASGTADGCSGLEQDRLLQPGDVVEVEVDRIGVLRNRIVRQAGAPA